MSNLSVLGRRLEEFEFRAVQGRLLHDLQQQRESHGKQEKAANQLIVGLLKNIQYFLFFSE